MFPLRYFPGRYFPDRYFPKGTGVVPPPPVVVAGQIRLKISGRDVTNYIDYQSSLSWSLVRGARGSCSLPLIVAPGDPTAPQVGELIEIFDPPTTRVWAGTIEGLEILWHGDAGWHTIMVQGVTLERLFDTVVLDKIKYAKAAGAPFTAGAVVSDIYTRSGVTQVTLGTISTGPDIQGIEVNNAWTGFADVALLAGFVLYIDPSDLKLYFHAPAARTAPWTLASGNVLWETLDWTQARSDVRDSQVIQLPGQATAPVDATFPGDGSKTKFTLPAAPEYLISLTCQPTGLIGKVVGWTPGSPDIFVTPPLLATETLAVRYADLGEVSATTGFTPGFGTAKGRYTTTRTFTPAAGLQQAQALIARYSMLPSALKFETDKPGINIAQALTVDLDNPIEAGSLLNGTWLVTEVDGAIVPGLDRQAEPYGHFRYTLMMVNVAATAVFQGDGSTTVFVLPEIPSSVTGIRVSQPLWPDTVTEYATSWAPGTDQVTVTPAPIDGSSVNVGYVGANAPEVPGWQQTLGQLAGAGGSGANVPNLVLPPPPAGDPVATPPAVFQRTLLIKDTTVGNDIADHVPIYHDGYAMRLLGVLRKTIAADLTVRIHKIAADLSSLELIVATIPSGAVIDDVFEWSLAAGSPALLPPFFDKEVLTADILESDGTKDVDGIASFTVEWQHA